jgi:hypothetical protein
MITPKFESVWDALFDDSDEDLKKRSDYLILIQARLYGMSGSEERKAELIGIHSAWKFVVLQIEQTSNLLQGEKGVTYNS